MVTRIYEQIRKIIENTPGKTQKGLAEHMGLNPAAVNRLIHGRRNIMATEIPVIEDYLGVKLDLSGGIGGDFEYRQDKLSHHHGFSDVPMQPAPRPTDNYVPVYGAAPDSLQKCPNLESGAVVDWVARHPAQAGGNAFAIYVFSDAMEPRYFAGELVYVHPGRPPEQGRDCVIEMQNGDAHITRYLRQSVDNIRVAQFNPPEEKDIPRDEVKAVYAVVGRG